MTDEKRTVLYFLALLGICVLALAIGVGILVYLSDYDALGIALMYILVAAIFWGGLLLLSKVDNKLENRRRAR